MKGGWRPLDAAGPGLPERPLLAVYEEVSCAAMADLDMTLRKILAAYNVALDGIEQGEELKDKAVIAATVLVREALRAGVDPDRLLVLDSRDGLVRRVLEGVPLSDFRE